MAAKEISVQVDGQMYQVTEKKYGGAVLVELLTDENTKVIWDRSIHGPIPSEIAQRAIDKAGSKVKYTKHQLANPDALLRQSLDDLNTGLEALIKAAPVAKPEPRLEINVAGEALTDPQLADDGKTFIIKDVPFVDTPPEVVTGVDIGRRSNHLRARVTRRDGDRPIRIKATAFRPGDKLKNGKVVKSVQMLDAPSTPGIMITLKCHEMAAVLFEGAALPVLMTDHSWFYVHREMNK